MKIDILVPHYKETSEIMKPLLDSLAIQQGFNFEDLTVIYCADGTDIVDSNLTKQYPFKIKNYVAPHGGVSATRNKLLELSSAEYVMYCDADDMFMSALALWTIEYTIFNTGKETPDIIVSTFIQDVQQNGKHMYSNRANDGTFVHGKVYKRKYLIDNKIKWDPELTLHEDSYFNTLAVRLTNNIRVLQTPIYLWKWRADSVVRTANALTAEYYQALLISANHLIKQFLKRGKRELAREYAVTSLYSCFNSQQNHKVEFKEILRNHKNDFKDLYNECPLETKQMLAKIYVKNTVEWFEDWLVN